MSDVLLKRHRMVCEYDVMFVSTPIEIYRFRGWLVSEIGIREKPFSHFVDPPGRLPKISEN